MYGEESVDAAKILLSLRHRKLQRWPDWVPRSSSAAEKEVVVVKLEVPVRCPNRRRTLPRVRRKGPAWWVPKGVVLAWRRSSRSSAGTGASPGGEDGARSQNPKVEVESMAAGRPEVSPCDVAPSGSGGPSTSGVDRARSPTEKVAAPKETMAAASPDTPLNYPAAAAGSAASSSGYDGTRSSPAKRMAPRGDEGCNSSAKRPRADLDVEELKPEKKTGDQENYRDEKGHLLFDLNVEIAPWQD